MQLSETLRRHHLAGRAGRLRAGLDAQRIVVWLVIAVIAYLVLVPLAVLVYGSLTDVPPGQATALTLEKYRDAWTSSSTYRALGNTFLFAGGSSTLAFLFGTYLAWVAQRTNTPLRRLIFVGALAPVFIPSVLMVVSWILLLSPQVGAFNLLARHLFSLDAAPFDVYTMAGMIWVAGVIETPLAFLWMWPAFNAMDPSLEEAASVSGAGPSQTFWRIVLRLVSPAMLATWLIVFVRQLESFGVPGLLGMPRGIYVLATEIFLTTTRSPRDINLASAYAVILVLLTVVGIVLYRRATAASERFATITGKGYRPRTVDLGPLRWATLAGALLLLLFMIGLPVLALLFSSFLPYLQAPTMDSLRQLTLDNYREALGYEVAFRSFWNSTILGVASGVIVMALASVAGWIVVRSRLPGRGAIDLLASVPVAIPGIVVGLSVLWVYLMLPIPIYGTLFILLIAYLTRYLPYGMRISYTAFSQIHRELEEAAYVSGGSWWHTFRRVSVPLLAPAFFVGVLYILLHAYRELPASIMLVHHGTEVFSVTVWDLWAGGYAGRLAAVGVLAIAALSVMAGAAQLLGARLGIRS